MLDHCVLIQLSKCWFLLKPNQVVHCAQDHIHVVPVTKTIVLSQIESCGVQVILVFLFHLIGPTLTPLSAFSQQAFVIKVPDIRVITADSTLQDVVQRQSRQTQENQPNRWLAVCRVLSFGRPSQ